MDGEQFYEEFKAVLKFFELEWGQKEQLTVTVYDDCQLQFKCEGRSVLLDLDKWHDRRETETKNS